MKISWRKLIVISASFGSGWLVRHGFSIEGMLHWLHWGGAAAGAIIAWLAHNPPPSSRAESIPISFSTPQSALADPHSNQSPTNPS